MKEVNFSNFAKILYDFEAEEIKYLKNLDLKGWLVWPIIKRPLFYLILIEGLQQNDTPLSSRFSMRITQVGSLLKGLLNLLIKPRPTSLTFSHTQCKLEYDENGKAINFLTDPLLLNGLLPQNLNFCISDQGRLNRNSLIADDFIVDSLYLPIGISRRWMKKRRIKEISEDLSRRINQYLSSNSYDLAIDAKTVGELLSSFYAEKKIYSMLFKFLKPRRIFFMDSLGTGRMCAAKELNIQTFDFQHGLIDEYKPDYILHNGFKSRKKHMPIPDYICSFGQFFSEVLLKTKFWDRDELIEVGNYRINKARKLLSDSIENPREHIFFPTQWHVFQESKMLVLDFLKKMDKHPNSTLHIKPHPRELEGHMKWYDDICRANRNLILYDKEISVYEAVIECDLCVGFDSTFLLESLALGIPTVTIATEDSPRGIHSMLGDDKLTNEITILSVDSFEEFYQKFTTDGAFRKSLTNKTEKVRDSLFEKNYLQNLKQVLQ